MFVIWLQLEEDARMAEFDSVSYNLANRWNWQDFTTNATRREFQKISNIGSAVLVEDDFNRVGYEQSSEITHQHGSQIWEWWYNLDIKL